MINKKILLSLLTVGLLACVASASTWAYFQDTVTSTDNQLTTATLTSEYSLNAIQSTWIPFAGDLAEFGPFNADNLIPDFTSHITQPIYVHNMGTTDATVIATITPGTPVDVVQDLVIKVGTHTIYEDGAFVTGSIIWTVGTAGEAGASIVDASISYIYSDTESSQNPDETQSIPFNMSIAERAIAPV